MKQPIKRGRLMSEINITPFTDVVLVLLIIFMVTTPLFIQSGIKIKLPASTTSESQTDKNVTIKLSSSGTIFLNEKPIRLERLEPELTARAASDSEIFVVINADKQLPYNDVIRVIDIVKKAGVKKLALGVDYQQKTPGK